MKRFAGIFAALLVLASCNPTVEPEEPPKEEEEKPVVEPADELGLRFITIWEDLYQGESTSVKCEIIGGDPAAKYTIRYVSSDPSVATVTAAGSVLAKKPGKTVITASIEDTDVSVSRDYYVIDLSQLKRDFSRDLVMVKGHTIFYKAVMQSWDFFDDWFYVNQVCGSPHTLTYTRKPVLSQTPQTYMHLKYYGHGDNMFVERASDGDYLWTSNYGTLEAGQTNRYTDSQVLSRIKFVAGKTMLPEDSNFNFVMPEMKRIIAAYDADNDNVGIWCRSAAGKAWIYVYAMKALMEAQPEFIQLSFSRSYGDPVVTDQPTVLARDLSKITPTIKFQMPFNNVPQGYDFHHNKIYYMRGDGAEKEEREAGTNNNWARVYYISPRSQKTLIQVDLPWVDDLNLLATEGFTDLGYFEPEGIKLKDGVIYLGFASKDAGSSPARRVNIMKYTL